MSTSAQPVQESTTTAMRRTNNIFNEEVFGKRNYSALREIYTANARVLPPGAPMITGPSAIQGFWSTLIESVNATSAQLTTIEVTEAGSGLVEIGKAVIDMQPAGQEPSQLEVKYVVYWKHEDARWKWDIDIWNMNS